MHTHPEQMKQREKHTRYPLKLFFLLTKRGNKGRKKWRKLQVQWTLRGKSPSGKLFQQKSGQKNKTVSPFETKSPLIHSLVSLINDWSPFFKLSNRTKNKRRETWCEGKSRSSSRPRVHLSEWDFSSAVGSEVRLCDGWCCSGLLSDVVTAWAVALLVWDALREGELVHLRSLFFQLQRGFWKTKARHKNANPWNETHW